MGIKQNRVHGEKKRKKTKQIMSQWTEILNDTVM